MKKTFLPVITALLLVFGFVSISAAAEPEELIKYRKNVMKSIGGHMGNAGAILFGKVDQKDHLMVHINGLQAASMLTRDVFPEDSAIGETGAKQEIWDQPEDFAKAVEALETAVNNLAEVAQGGDMGQIVDAYKKVGGSCKGCHDDFRQKKQ